MQLGGSLTTTDTQLSAVTGALNTALPGAVKPGELITILSRGKGRIKWVADYRQGVCDALAAKVAQGGGSGRH